MEKNNTQASTSHKATPWYYNRTKQICCEKDFKNKPHLVIFPSRNKMAAATTNTDHRLLIYKTPSREAVGLACECS